jgi:hypothetical protein
MYVETQHNVHCMEKQISLKYEKIKLRNVWKCYTSGIRLFKAILIFLLKPIKATFFCLLSTQVWISKRQMQGENSRQY